MSGSRIIEAKSENTAVGSSQRKASTVAKAKYSNSISVYILLISIRQL